MKSWTRKFLSAAVAASLGLGAVAVQAQPRPGPPPGHGGPDMRHDNRRPDMRHDNRRPDYRGGPRHDMRGAGPNHDWQRGYRVPPQYRSHHYVVNDWRGHHLSAPPRGYHWIQTGGDDLLVAIATGVIASMVLNSGY